MDIKRFFRLPVFWIVLLVIGVLLLGRAFSGQGSYEPRDTAVVMQLIDNGEVRSAAVLTGNEHTLRVTTNDGDQYETDYAESQQEQITTALQKQFDRESGQGQDGQNGGEQGQGEGEGETEEPQGYTVEETQPSVIGQLLITLLPFALLVILFLFLINHMQGGGNRVMQFGKSKAKLITKDTPKTTFTDVAGSDEAVEELGEIKEFLAEPAKFQAVGAKIPKGVLLYGPPGTGKTLLARAVAGEAGVPFYSISGSDFVEMFVGVGASRVRDLFEQAKANAPAIVFVDEIDAVGRQRGAGMGGGHDEREQTLNQLLVEMDGFDVRGGVILIAATNRPDILDPALLRPGRFDRQIGVEAPDLKGREHILQVHARGKPTDEDVDMLAVARRTPGFSGADLENVLNEAALLTARREQKLIDNRSLDEAIDRVIAGPQKRTRVMSDKEKLVTAYHEGGHALVATAFPGADPVHKLTILPRGRALGYAMVLPDEDKYSTTRGELLDKLAYMMGGRASEEMVFHDPSTGAANDIEKATSLARAMVTQYGMTERLGAIKFGENNGEPFLGRELGHQRNYSEEVAALVDEEVRRLIENAHQEAYDILVENREILDGLVRELLEKETLDKAQLAAIFDPMVKRSPRPAWTGSPTRRPSELPPVTPNGNGDASAGLVIGPVSEGDGDVQEDRMESDSDET